MHRYLIGLFSLLLLMGLSDPVVAAGERHVLIVLSGSGDIYQEVAQTIMAMLRASVHPAPEIKTEILPETNVPRSAPQERGTPDVIVTVGVRAAQVALQSAGKTPVFSVLIPKNTFVALTAARELSTEGNADVSAIYLDQPFARQVDLARLLLPQAKRLGVLLGSRTLQERAAYVTEGSRVGFELISAPVSDERAAASAIRDLAERVDVIVAVHDPTVLTPSTAKWLLYMAYQRHVPVIGFSVAYMTAGALASVYSTPAQIGRQAGETLAAGLRRDPLKLGVPMYSKYFSADVNQAVAESLGVESADAWKIARKLGAE